MKTMVINTNIQPADWSAKKFLPQNQSISVGGAISSTFLQPTDVAPGGISSLIHDRTSLIHDRTSPTHNTTTANILKELLDSKFEFHLGGSRSMYKRGADIIITNETDYDFYVTDSQEVRVFLYDNEFRSSTINLDYLDNECEFIMKKDKIDVVLRKDAKFYKKVFDNIPVELFVKHLWKGNPKCDRTKIKLLFNEMYKIAHEKEQNLTKTQIESITTTERNEFSRHNTENIPF